MRVNFGQSPFLFDIDGMVAVSSRAIPNKGMAIAYTLQHESLKIRDEINSVNVASLQPPLDEDSLIKELISQFLAHDGYVETAKAFAGEVRTEASALRSGSNTTLDTVEIEDDLDAVNRQSMAYILNTRSTY